MLVIFILVAVLALFNLGLALYFENSLVKLKDQRETRESYIAVLEKKHEYELSQSSSLLKTRSMEIQSLVETTDKLTQDIADSSRKYEEKIAVLLDQNEKLQNAADQMASRVVVLTNTVNPKSTPSKKLATLAGRLVQFADISGDTVSLAVYRYGEDATGEDS